MDNLRTDPRKETIYHSKIFDAISGELIGHQLNVSARGICMFSKWKFAAGQKLHISMKLPRPQNGRETVEFVAVVRWCAADVNPDYYDIGLEVSGNDKQVTQILEEILSLHCFAV